MALKVANLLILIFANVIANPYPICLLCWHGLMSGGASVPFFSAALALAAAEAGASTVSFFAGAMSFQP